VKCDETKPSCNRCLKWKGSCSGYGADSEPTSPPLSLDAAPLDEETWTPDSQVEEFRFTPVSQNERRLVPKSTPAGGSDSAGPSTPEQTTHRYDTSAFGPDFWLEEVPRIVQSFPAMGLASLAVRMAVQTKPPTLAGSESDDRENQNERAFACYGEALRNFMQSSMGHVDIRPAILCSLLFLIFDLFHDDMTAAKAHFHNGQRMLDEHLKTRHPESPGNTMSLQAELDHAMHLLAEQLGDNVVPGWGQMIHERASLLASDAG
jgi:hypothetical protein